MTTAVSILLATIISFITFTSNLSAQGEVSWDSEAYAKAVNGRLPILSEISFGQIPPPRCEITWDPIFEAAWDKIEDANGFHMAKTADLMPDPFYYTRWQAAALPWLFNGVGDRLLDKSMVYHEQNKTLLKTVYRLAGAGIKMPTKLHFSAEPIEDNPNEYEFVGYFTYMDGSKVHVKTGTTYNTKTGRLGGEDGFGNLGYNYYVDDNYLESTPGSWQRRLGYTKLYDDLFLQSSNLVNLDTVRMTFSHAGRDWLFQLWKGRYFNMPGGEVGLYHKPDKRPVGFYDTIGDDELVGLTFKLSDKRNGKVLLDRPLEPHWWRAGFSVYEKPLTGENLTLETILAPQDDALLEAIKAALDKAVAKGELTYTTLNTKLGAAVRIVW